MSHKPKFLGLGYGLIRVTKSPAENPASSMSFSVLWFGIYHLLPPKFANLFFSQLVSSWGIFKCISFNTDKDYFIITMINSILMVYTSCNISYNVLRHSHHSQACRKLGTGHGSISACRGTGVGIGVVDIQKREYSDLIFPEAGISVINS